MGVASPRIVEAVRCGAARSVEDVIDATGAGGGCTSCHPEIQEILADLGGRAVGEEARRANRVTCHDSTVLRIEGALYQGVQPGLANTEVELVSVEGLRVDLHLHGDDDESIRARVAGRLRKLICSELDVVFG